MQRFKKQIAFLFGMIAMVTYLSVRYFPSEKETTSVIQTTDEQIHMQVYLMDGDKTLVPISIPVDEEMSEEDKINLMIGYMSGKQKIKGFSPLFEKEVSLEGVHIQDGVAVLNFNESLLQYNKDNELRVLEALTWGSTQFHDVEQVKLQLNGEPLSNMPNANTPIPDVLNRSIGINHFETAVSALHSSDELTVFYTKKVEGTTYMVPKSKRYPAEKASLMAKVNEIMDDVSVSSSLIQPMVKDRVELESMSMEDGLMKVSLNKNILGADKTLKQDVYDSLTLSLLSLEEVKQVQVLVDDVVVSIGGDETPVSMNDVIYNVVKF